jgi:hypothetical protein
VGVDVFFYTHYGVLLTFGALLACVDLLVDAYHLLVLRFKNSAYLSLRSLLPMIVRCICLMIAQLKKLYVAKLQESLVHYAIFLQA